MGILAIILIALSLSVDSFSVSLSVGTCHKNITRNEWLKVSLFMSFFQAFFPLLGWLAGAGVKGIIEDYDHWIAFILLFLVGGKMILDGFKKHDDDCKINYTKTLVVIGLSVATSIDALIVGVSFGMLNTSMIFPVIIFGICTFIFSSLGIFLGKLIGHRLNFKFEIIGGLAIISIGLKILFDHI